VRRAALLILVLVCGCSEDNGPPPSPECTAGAAEVAKALEAAPRDVRLVDGTRLSDCVRRADSDAQQQELGIVLTDVAEDLEAEAADDPRAALRLGYLVGAARRGAPGDSSLQFELVRRLEGSVAGELPPESRDALAEGLAAGEARG
jgi:hypothetical protein